MRKGWEIDSLNQDYEHSNRVIEKLELELQEARRHQTSERQQLIEHHIESLVALGVKADEITQLAVEKKLS